MIDQNIPIYVYKYKNVSFIQIIIHTLIIILLYRS